MQENWPIKKKSNDTVEDARTVFVDVKNINREGASLNNRDINAGTNSLDARSSINSESEASIKSNNDKVVGIGKAAVSACESNNIPCSSKRPHEDQENLDVREKTQQIENTPLTSKKKLIKTDSAGSQISKKRLRRL